MEFFASINAAVSEQDLQQQLQIENLPRFCASIYEVVSSDKNRGEVSMLWGLFDVRRECIRGGVRFILPGCLNAVSWTVTVSPDEGDDEITVHCTINRKQQDADFVESLEDFVEDWRKGLLAHLSANTRTQETCEA